MEIITRKEAKERGLKKYFTGVPCKRGHVCERYVSGHGCIECVDVNNHNWRTANPEHYKETLKEYGAKYSAEHKEERKIKRKQYIADNPEKIAETARKYRKSNSHKRVAWQTKRIADQLDRTPPWLTPEQLFEIEMFYKNAADLTKETGIQHHVDHIYPMRGKTASGLHVPWNLQVITKTENLRKSNKLPEL